MVVGRDMEIGDVPKLLGQATVGRFCGKIVSAPALISSLDDNWSKVLGYRLEFHTLARDCICFKFHTKEDLALIFESSWG
jgi:hypothetical protein